MKKLITLFALIITVTINAQNDKYDKIIIATIKDFNMSMGEFELLDENGVFIKETFTPAYGKMEPKDLIDDIGTELNPKYKGKKGKIYCTKKSNGGWEIQKVDFNAASVEKAELVNSPGQVADNAPKTFTVTGTITIGKQGMACAISVQDGTANTLTVSLGKLKTERSKYFDGYCKLNPLYEGKKFIIIYTTRTYAASGTMVTTTNLVDLKTEKEIATVFEKDNFSTATCRAYDIYGKLIAIMDNNTIYPIKEGKKEEGEAKAIQNKDEVCVRGNQCVKAKVEADGFVNLYNLPNVTDKTATLKIIGDKIYRTQKNNTDIDEYKEFYFFKGNKTHAALIAVVTRMGMGR